MIAITVFLVFFVILYLTRPGRKKRRAAKVMRNKADLDKLRQQAMGNFWAQALAQSQATPVLHEEMMEQAVETPTKTEEISQQDDATQGNRTTEQVNTYAAFVQYLRDFENSQKVNTAKTGPAQTASPPHDHSVIDVSPEVRPINYAEDEESDVPDGLTAYAPGVPYWAHHYVYSETEINQATREQQNFYRLFKAAFLKGILYDIGDNSNYAFILYFDLIRDYRSHQDIRKLEQQFRQLEQICERIAGYAGSFLVKEIRERGLVNNLTQLNGAWSTLRSDRPSYLNWDWRSLYQQKMQLTNEEASLLEHVYLSSGAFMNIDFICRQVIRLYIELVKALYGAYRQNGTDKDKEFRAILDTIARKQHRYHTGSPNYQYIVEHDSALYAYILRYAESALRSYYGYNRKLSIEGYLDHPEVKAIMQEKILSHLEQKVSGFYALLEPLDEVNEIELNAISPARWRTQLDAAINSGGPETLLSLNQKNPSKDILLYEMARALIPTDKPAALSWYFRHVFQCKLDKKAWKLPTAAMNKQLFKTQQDSERFYAFLNQFMLAPDLTGALEFAKTFYQTVRKKITFDTMAIKQAETRDSQTTELLGSYLGEEEPEPIIVPEATQVSMPDISTAINLSEPAKALLSAFQVNGFTLMIADAEAFCQSIGMMASPLINSINEACYDLLDENLIENQQSCYSIQPAYYYQILNK